jgi:TRAP-type uncharacterized transport system fused permease subunit
LRTIRFIIDVILVMLLLAGVYYSSSQPYEKQDIRGSIERHLGGGEIEEKLDGLSLTYGGKKINADTVGFGGLVEFFLRKGIHFLTFAILTFLFYRLLRHFHPPNAAIPWSGLLAVLAAALDEWHQTFTPNRTGMVADVILDASGVAVALIILGAIAHKNHREHRTKNGG